MKFICFMVLLLNCKASVAQQWTLLHDSKIQRIEIVDNRDTLIFFKSDSIVIGVPSAMANDFQSIFLQDAKSFKMISDSCLQLRTFMVSDSVEAIFKKLGIKSLVYFIKREIEGKGEKETWIMTNPYGQGLLC